MAISDALATLASDTALNTGGAGSYIIGDQIDLQVVDNGLGALIGHAALYLVIVVEDDATSGGSATAQFNLVTDDVATLDDSPVVLASTPVFAVADMTPGVMLAVLPLPISTNVLQFLGLQQVTAVAAFTAGSVNAYITPTPPHRHQYPQNDAISY